MLALGAAVARTPATQRVECVVHSVREEKGLAAFKSLASVFGLGYSGNSRLDNENPKART